MRSVARYAVYAGCGLFVLLASLLSLLLQPVALIVGGVTFLVPWGLSLRLTHGQVRR